MKTEKKGRTTVYKCGKRYETPEKKEPDKKEKKISKEDVNNGR